MRLIVIIAGLLLPMALQAGVTWPDLEKTCFVKGRIATQDDVNAGCAAFAMKPRDRDKVEPITDITIPQYGYFKDKFTGRETPIVVIQGERRGNIRVLGYTVVGSKARGTATMDQVRLIGDERP